MRPLTIRSAKGSPAPRSLRSRVPHGTMPPMAHGKKKLIGLFLSLLFLWLALRHVEWSLLPAIFFTIRPGFVGLMVISMFWEHAFRAGRWRVILARPSVGVYHLYAGIILGYLFNNLLPARIGEVVRAVYLGRRTEVHASEAFGSIVVERFFDGLVALTFVTLAIHLFPVDAYVQVAGRGLAIVALVGFLGLLVSQHQKSRVQRLVGFFCQILPGTWPERISRWTASFLDGTALVAQPGRFALAALLTVISWGFSLLTLWLCFQAFSLPFGLPEVILLAAMLSIGAMIPSSPGMIGIYEYICMVVFVDMLKQSSEMGASFGIFPHSFSYGIILIIGLVIMTYENLSVSELEANANAQVPEDLPEAVPALKSSAPEQNQEPISLP
jgi:glycosyltransferase 2 family protein